APLLAQLPGWRDDFSDVPIAQLARRLDSDPKGLRLHGVQLPRDARELRLPVRVIGASAVLRLAIQRRDGTFGRLLPAATIRPGRVTLVSPVPPRDRGGVAVALEVTPLNAASWSTKSARVKPGMLSVTRASGATTALTDFTGWMPASEGTFDGGVFEY